MPADAGIYSQIRPFTMEDPLTQAGRAMAVKNAQLQNQEAERKFTLEDDMSGALARSGGDLGKASQDLAARGRGTAALQLREKAATQGKADIERKLKIWEQAGAWSIGTRPGLPPGAAEERRRPGGGDRRDRADLAADARAGEGARPQPAGAVRPAEELRRHRHGEGGRRVLQDARADRAHDRHRRHGDADEHEPAGGPVGPSRRARRSRRPARPPSSRA
jgi:hypothetical protein